jgi:hypothetical protein
VSATWTSNPYYNPEKCGLKIVGSVGDGGGYDWHVVLVFEHPDTAQLYMWGGAGCSCYEPCDDVRSLADLTPLRSCQEFRRFVADEEDYSRFDSGEVLDLQRKLRYDYKLRD